jgi:inner membrane transporter RhtA
MSDAPVTPQRDVSGAGGAAGAGGAQWPVAVSAGLIVLCAISVQSGAGIAYRQFGTVPPAAVTALRLWGASAIMLTVGGRGLVRACAGLIRDRSWSDAGTACTFGIALGFMNFCIYQSFARIPLGLAVTIEFLGPLAVAVAGSRRPRDLAWVVLAAGGVALLGRGGHGHLNLAGVAFGFGSAAGWAAYILLSKATGRRFPGGSGLAIAMCVAALAVTVPGTLAGGSAMFRPALLATGLGIGLLSSVIPYWLDLEVLRRLPARVFGVWMSAEPAIAALIGLVMLGQRLSLQEWGAICCVMIACAGAARALR